MSGVFPNVRGALTFAAGSQDVVTAATVAIGVLELGVETSAEIDGQLFVVLSALTEGESFDIVMTAGGDHGFESWRKLHGRWNPRAKLPELMGAIEKMEDLVRRYCSRRDAQGNARNLAEDIRMSSLEALLPDDLEKHVQLNPARLTSYGVLREQIKTYCECRGHAARNVRQKGPSHPGGDDPMDIGAFGKGKGKQSKGKHGKGKEKGKGSVECWNCGKRGHYSKDCWSKKNTKGGSKGKHKPKNADAHNLDSKPSIDEPEVEIDEFSMTYLNVMDFKSLRRCEGLDGSRLELTQVQERRHGLRVSRTERRFLVTVISLSAQRLENLSKVASECKLWVATIGDRISEFEVFKAPVCKPLLSVGEYTTMGGVTVLYGDKGYMFHKGSNVAQKIDAWV